MAQIICNNISLGYDGRIVCEDLSFCVNAGDYICIVGANGSGKSTLVKALLSLKACHKGNIEFGDGLSRHDVGYLPQQSEAQKDFPASVREVVISGCVGGLGKKFFDIAKSLTQKFGKNKMMLNVLTTNPSKKFYEKMGGKAVAKANISVAGLLYMEDVMEFNF